MQAERDVKQGELLETRWEYYDEEVFVNMMGIGKKTHHFRASTSLLSDIIAVRVNVV